MYKADQQHRNHMDGGKYINEGTYGCSFHPALPCKGSAVKARGIGKVFGNPRHFREENHILKFVKKLDPKSEFTVPYYGSCDIKFEQVKKTDHTEKCNKINNELSSIHHKKNHTWPQLLFKFGGDDLEKVYRSINKPKYKKLTVDDIIIMLRPVLRGLIRLNYSKMCHLDIKPPNMLLNKNRLLLIDFGLLEKATKVSSIQHVIEYNYFYYPPEFTVLNMLRKGIRDPNDVYDRFLRNLLMYGVRDMLDYMEFANYETKLKEFIRITLANTHITAESYEQIFTKVFVHKVDTYSLGMSLIEIIFELQSHNQLRFTRNSPTFFKKFVTDILSCMIDPNPYTRLTTTQLYIKYVHFLKSMNKEDAVITNIGSDDDKHESTTRHASHDDSIGDFMSLKDLKDICKKNDMEYTGSKTFIYKLLKNTKSITI